MTSHFEESIITGTLAMSGSRGDEVEEPRHRRGRVEHRLVHVDVDDLGARVDLLRGRPRPPRRTGPSRMSLANLREPVTFVRSPTLTKTLPGCGIVSGSRPDRRVLALDVRRSTRGGSAGDGLGDRPDVGRRRPAAAAGDVDQAVAGELRRAARPSSSGRLVVATELVRQPRVRVGADGDAGDPRQVRRCAPRSCLRAERAVEPDRDRPGVRDRRPERLDGLARERPAGGVGDRAGDDQRDAVAERVERGSRRRRSRPWR